MAIYDVKAGTGVTIYLNAIQLVKFVPFEGGANFDAIEDADDDAFEAFDDNGMAALPEGAENPTAQPRL